MSTKVTPTIPEMGDRLHKGKYPEGPAVQMTAAWKQLVRDRLKENKRNGVKPWDQKTLGEAVGAADKSGINKMFKGNTCRFVPEICRVLNIAPSLEERPERDSLDEEMALVTDPAVREAFAALLRSYRTK